jgi:hypothetical protein
MISITTVPINNISVSIVSNPGKLTVDARRTINTFIFIIIFVQR